MFGYKLVLVPLIFFEVGKALLENVTNFCPEVFGEEKKKSISVKLRIVSSWRPSVHALTPNMVSNKCCQTAHLWGFDVWLVLFNLLWAGTHYQQQ